MTDTNPYCFAFPELSPAMERRFCLSSFVDSATFHAKLLHSSLPVSKAVIDDIWLLLSKLKSLTSSFGGPKEDKAAITDAANRLKLLTSDLTGADPRLGTYYVGPIHTAAENLLFALSAPSLQTTPPRGAGKSLQHHGR